MNIGIVGAGAIASYILEEAKTHTFKVKSVFVRNYEKYAYLEEKYTIKLYTDLNEFLNSDVDIVVEAANVDVVKEYLPEICSRKDAIIISIGAFVDEDFTKNIKQALKKSKRMIHLPSGAIGGLDLIKNARAAGHLSRVALETRKPAQSLMAEKITEARVIFEGRAKEAIKQYPKNINVSIALSLVGIGFEKTEVCIIADPYLTKNQHQITIQGDFGEAVFQIQNEALPTNPKTSYLAAMSIIGTLDQENNSLRIG